MATMVMAPSRVCSMKFGLDSIRSIRNSHVRAISPGIGSAHSGAGTDKTTTQTTAADHSLCWACINETLPLYGGFTHHLFDPAASARQPVFWSQRDVANDVLLGGIYS